MIIERNSVTQSERASHINLSSSPFRSRCVADQELEAIGIGADHREPEQRNSWRDTLGSGAAGHVEDYITKVNHHCGKRRRFLPNIIAVGADLPTNDISAVQSRVSRSDTKRFS